MPLVDRCKQQGVEEPENYRAKTQLKTFKFLKFVLELDSEVAQPDEYIKTH